MVLINLERSMLFPCYSKQLLKEVSVETIFQTITSFKKKQKKRPIHLILFPTISKRTGGLCIVHTMAIRVVEFSNGGTKLERFLPKNQHAQRKLLNFEN